MDRFDQAIRTYAKGVERFPDDFNLNYYYAFALFRMAQHQGLKGRRPTSPAGDRKGHPIGFSLCGRLLSRAKYYTMLDPNPKLATDNLEKCLDCSPDMSRQVPIGSLYAKAKETGSREAP